MGAPLEREAGAQNTTGAQLALLELGAAPRTTQATAAGDFDPLALEERAPVAAKQQRPPVAAPPPGWDDADRDRLATLQDRVEAHADGIARSIADWVALVGGSATGVSARLRHARRRGFHMEARCLERGLWSYSLSRAT
jgi:hypothetical protein